MLYFFVSVFKVFLFLDTCLMVFENFLFFYFYFYFNNFCFVFIFYNFVLIFSNVSFGVVANQIQDFLTFFFYDFFSSTPIFSTWLFFFFSSYPFFLFSISIFVFFGIFKDSCFPLCYNFHSWYDNIIILIVSYC